MNKSLSSTNYYQYESIYLVNIGNVYILQQGHSAGDKIFHVKFYLIYNLHNYICKIGHDTIANTFAFEYWIMFFCPTNQN